MGLLDRALTTTSTAVVVGASKGIGLALTAAILQRGSGRVVAASRRPAESEALRSLAIEFPGRVTPIACDTTDAPSLQAMSAQIRQEHNQGIDLLLNVAGVLHETETGIMPERSLASIDPERMARVLATNAMGPVLTTQALQKQLNKGALIGNLSARVGSIGDNGLGGWWS
jgi:NAD(P)-dependent dehydrogenase (short-subunit alcohol dehydrogenase family)